jgi:hypothetical protein
MHSTTSKQKSYNKAQDVASSGIRERKIRQISNRHSNGAKIAKWSHTAYHAFYTLDPDRIQSQLSKESNFLHEQ